MKNVNGWGGQKKSKKRIKVPKPPLSGLGGKQWLGGEVLLCNNFFKDSIFFHKIVDQ